MGKKSKEIGYTLAGIGAGLLGYYIIITWLTVYKVFSIIINTLTSLTTGYPHFGQSFNMIIL